MTLGVLTAFAAMALFTGGNALQKHAVGGIPELEFRRVLITARRLLRSPIWVAGSLASVLGIAAQVVAYHLIAIVEVQAIAIAGLILLVACGHVFLHERFGRHEIAGVLLAACSLLLLLLPRSPGSSQIPLGEVETRFAVALAVTTACAIAVLIATAGRAMAARGFLLGFLAGIFYGMSSVGAKGMSTLIGAHHQVLIGRFLTTPFSYAFVATWLGGFVLFQKGIQGFRLGIVGPTCSMSSSTYAVIAGSLLFGEHLFAGSAGAVSQLIGFGGVCVASVLIAVGDARRSLDVVGPSA